MIKFYLMSLILHIIIFIFKFDFIKEEKIELVEKKTMTVSLKNRRGRSNDVAVNTSVPDIDADVKNSPDIKSVPEEKKEEVKENKKNPEILKVESEKKIQKKIRTKKNEKKTKRKASSVKKVKSQRVVYNEFLDKDRFILGNDGIFTAISTKGIKFQIIKEVDPKYPKKAKDANFFGTAMVEVRFTVGVDGRVEQITFISGETRYGFKEETFKAVKNWKFKPIVHEGQRIKVVFEKNFVFK